uniref:Uncharacterized protein n=1 Tax=viral metagenome TaxID=1070528 RepID=A0A6M3M9I2_9ZZZZ
MGRAKHHNLDAVIASLGGILLSGYGDSDALTIEPNSDSADVSVGADGETVVNVINDDNYLLTIHLMETSAAVVQLDVLYKAQRTAMRIGPLLPQPFRMSDPISGESVSTDRTVFLRPPDRSKGSKSGMREYKLLLSAPTIIPPALNVV